MIELTAEKREELNTYRPTVARWKARFEQDRIPGLDGRHKGSRPRKVTPAVQARLVKKTQQKPGDGSTHWSCRKMAAAVGRSPATVQRIWSKTKLKLARRDRYMASNDPAFEQRAADMNALYIGPATTCRGQSGSKARGPFFLSTIPVRDWRSDFEKSHEACETCRYR